MQHQNTARGEQNGIMAIFRPFRRRVIRFYSDGR